MTLASIPLMDRTGRRTLHLYGLGGMFIFSIFITISFLIKASTVIDVRMVWILDRVLIIKQIPMKTVLLSTLDANNPLNVSIVSSCYGEYLGYRTLTFSKWIFMHYHI